jgi:type IV secretory pathway component VirB8
MESQMANLTKPTDVRDEEYNTRQMLLNVNRRMQVATVSAALAALAACGALVMLMPLKQTVPYVVNVNRTTGEVTVPQQQSWEKFDPDWMTVSFFLRRWVSDLFTINRYLTAQITDPRAQEFLRGTNAIAEFKEFRAQDQTYLRLAQDPTLVRNVTVKSITPIAGTKNGALADVELTTISGGVSKVEHRLVTLYWIILKPDNPKDAEQNPLGIYITDFRVSGQ